MVKESFGVYLRSIREERDIPIRKLAAVLDIDQSTLGKIERGERLPKEELLSKIADYFGVDIEGVKEAYFSDKVLQPILDKPNPERFLAVAQEKLRYIKSKNYNQAKLNI